MSKQNRLRQSLPLFFGIVALFLFAPISVASREEIDCTVTVVSEYTYGLTAIVGASLEASFTNNLPEPVAVVTLAPLNTEGKTLFVRDYVAVGQTTSYELEWLQDNPYRQLLKAIPPGGTNALMLDVGQQSIAEHSVIFAGSSRTKSDEEKLEAVHRLIKKAENKYSQVTRCEVKGVTKASSFQ